MNKKSIPGGYDQETSNFELDFWENWEGVKNFDLHFKTYDDMFALSSLDFSTETILDIGSGPISIFEKIVSDEASITPYDLLAREYNELVPKKKFMISDKVKSGQKFSLITLFNMIDHVIYPEEVLSFACDHLENDGRLYLGVHLYQPHGQRGHPQNFSFSSIIDLVTEIFYIKSCSIKREGIPIPYMWCGELQQQSKTKHNGLLSLLWLKFKCAVIYYFYQFQRCVVKSMKIFGLRALLPKLWQF